MNKHRNHPHRLDQKEPHIFILTAMSSFASMGAIIFAPALPEIAQYFQISESHSQLTITLFLLGYAVGQLIYGPLANRYGRKPAFYIGIVIATQRCQYRHVNLTRQGECFSNHEFRECRHGDAGHLYFVGCTRVTDCQIAGHVFDDDYFDEYLLGIFDR